MSIDEESGRVPEPQDPATAVTGPGRESRLKPVVFFGSSALILAISIDPSRATTTTPETQRPQCRTGMALMCSGGTVVVAASATDEPSGGSSAGALSNLSVTVTALQ